MVSLDSSKLWAIKNVSQSGFVFLIIIRFLLLNRNEQYCASTVNRVILDNQNTEIILQRYSNTPLGTIFVSICYAMYFL